MERHQSTYDIVPKNDFERQLKEILITLPTNYDRKVYQIWQDNKHLGRAELAEASSHVRAEPLYSIYFLQNLGFIPIALGCPHIRYGCLLRNAIFEYFERHTCYQNIITLFYFKKIFSRYKPLRSSILTDDRIKIIIERLDNDLSQALENSFYNI